MPILYDGGDVVMVCDVLTCDSIYSLWPSTLECIGDHFCLLLSVSLRSALLITEWLDHQVRLEVRDSARDTARHGCLDNKRRVSKH